MAGIFEIKRWRREKNIDPKDGSINYDVYTLRANNYFLNSAQVVKATPADFAVGRVYVEGRMVDYNNISFVTVQMSDGSLALLEKDDFKKLQA